MGPAILSCMSLRSVVLVAVTVLFAVPPAVGAHGATAGVAAKKPPKAGKGPKRPKKPKKPSASDARAIVGIADQKTSMYADPRFQALGITTVRAAVRWDVFTNPRLLAELDQWMAAARASGARPLLTFDRGSRRPNYSPTPAELVRTMKQIRQRYPEAREFSTWNEANFNNSKRPELVARWWLALSKSCPTCTVLAVDLLDVPGANAWARKFVKAAGRAPAVWGLHNYVGMNRKSQRSTLGLLKAVPGRFWLTETGGIVRRNNGSKIKFPTGIPHAASVTKFVLGPMLKAAGSRIERVYLFNWDTGPVVTTWDSGFIGPDNKARPSLNVLAAYLGKTLPAQ